MLSPLLTVALVFIAALFVLKPLGLPYPGPLAVVLASLAALGQSRPAPWAALGLNRPVRPARLPLQVLGVAAGAYFAAALSTVLATRGLGWAPIDVVRFASLRGDAVQMLQMLAISWTTAALGEELLFRGFLQTRLQALLAARAGRFAVPAAQVLQALLFGLCHAYQGPTGVLVTASVGLAFGLAYQRLGSLWPVVIAHGLVDSFSMLALYAGVAAPR